jgi:hypothetical protein
MSTLDLTADIIDVRDVIARYEELEPKQDALFKEFESTPENEGVDYDYWKRNQIAYDEAEDEEFGLLGALLEELAGNGGDEEWRGEWYPITLIKDSYFIDYAEELVKDCGYISHDFPSWIAIDWWKTAEAVQEDYALVTVDDNDYWYR